MIVLPVITNNKIIELQSTQEYYDKQERCMMCDIVEHDTQVVRSRLIDEDEHFITIAPYAPAYPYETLLVPKRHSSNFESIDEDEVNTLSSNPCMSGCQETILREQCSRAMKQLLIHDRHVTA
jgi:UDPglucose--hexose-1-phosphate uridylyltransferase